MKKFAVILGAGFVLLIFGILATPSAEDEAKAKEEERKRNPIH